MSRSLCVPLERGPLSEGYLDGRILRGGIQRSCIRLDRLHIRIVRNKLGLDYQHYELECKIARCTSATSARKSRPDAGVNSPDVVIHLG